MLVYTTMRDAEEFERIEKIEFAKQEAFFFGHHELQCLGSKDSLNGKSSISGGFGLLGGSIKGNADFSGTESIKFIWKNTNLSQLLPTVLPANKVRIVFLEDDDNRKPFVTFSYFNTHDYNRFECEWAKHICYAIIYLNKKQVDDTIYFKFDIN